MSAELILGVRLLPSTFKTIKLDCVNLKIKVEDLRIEAAEKINIPKDSFELIYCGNVLEDDAILESCGLRNGAMVHVLNRKKPEQPVPAKPINEGSILQLANAFRSFHKSAHMRKVLHGLSKRPEVIENIIVTTPGLKDDPVAIAMLQDPDLMTHFTDPETIKRIAELHPVLVEAAHSIIASIHESAHCMQTMYAGPSSMNTPAPAYSYSIDNLSEDEEMAGDSSESSDSVQPGAASNSGITTAQLAAALSRATARTNFPLSGSSSSTSAGSLNSGVITTEMFNQAMQNAFASSTNPSTTPLMPPILPQAADLQRQLAQMHEIGLQDDTVNVQALQFTNGDVQAAIELVFSGFSDN